MRVLGIEAKHDPPGLGKELGRSRRAGRLSCRGDGMITRSG